MAKIYKQTLPKVLFTALVCLTGIICLTPSVFGESDLLNKPTDSQKTSSMSERIANRKKELKLELSTSVVSKIEQKCSEAQTKIGELKSKDTVAVDNYYKAYGEIADQVSILINRLSKQAVSTAGIQTALNQYIGSANQYLVNADKYKAALADMESMDCQADAEGFAASLADGRNIRAKLAADAAAAKTKVDGISAALIGAKDKL